MDTPSAGTLCLIREQVARRIGENRFQTWFGDGVELALDEQHLRVHVANEFAGNWIARNYLQHLSDSVTAVVGRDVSVEVLARPRGALSNGPTPAGPPHNGAAAPRGALPSVRADGPLLRGQLDSFVVGPSNRLAHAAACELIGAPVGAHKLLVVHGGCGLGKTHLLQAICNGVRRRHPLLEWRYVSGEEFTNEFIRAVKAGRGDAFRARFRTVDLLVIDDIHFLANKRATQDEFLHTFNAIDAAGKAVVLSSDRHPRNIATLGEPLVNRLISGMVVEIQPPDFVTRREILSRRAGGMSVGIPEDVLDFVARHITRNVRELEGALFKLAALASLTRDPITLELARFVLDDAIARAQRAPEPADIERVVAAYFGLTRATIHSRSRDRTVSLARALTMYLIRKHTTLSFPEIGRLLGNKNHSTVLMAAKRIALGLEEDQKVNWNDADGAHQAPLRDVLAVLERDLLPSK